MPEMLFLVKRIGECSFLPRSGNFFPVIVGNKLHIPPVGFWGIPKYLKFECNINRLLSH